MSEPKCPKCDCAVFDMVSHKDFSISFICCSACGAVVAYRDTLLLDKLDRIAEAIEFNDAPDSQQASFRNDGSDRH